MATTSSKKTLLFKDLHERREVKLDKPGTYYFGLNTDGCLCAETEEDPLCVKLYQVTFQCDGGCLLSPLNRDLKCVINSTEELNREINLINGTTLEIAEKRIVYIDGSIKQRRQLPATPGQTRDNKPPPKPARSRANNDGTPEPPQQAHNINDVPDNNGDVDNEDSDDGDTDEKRWLTTANLMVDLPADQQDKLNDLNTPEQISVLAATYFTKQLRMFTDAVVTAELIDDIFRLFMDTVDDCHVSFMMYLNSVSRTLAKFPDKTLHLAIQRPAVRLTTDLLRSCFDPISSVILILSFLRTFSHFDKNLPIMIRHQTTAAVIGSMTAFNMVADVQQHGLDILSKIANYAPKLMEKPQLKEVGIEQLIRAVKKHPDNINIGCAACRVLANLSSTLISLLNEWIDKDMIDSQEKFESFERLDKLQQFVFTEGIPLAQGIVNAFSEDLDVKMVFRRFVFFYAKHQHFQQKRDLWMLQGKFHPNLNTSVMSSVNGLTNSGSSYILSTSTESPGVSNDNTGTKHEPALDTDNSEETGNHSSDESPQGILKKSRSYECLRTSERKLNFDADTIGGSDSNSSSSDSDSGEFKLDGPLESEHDFEVDMEDDFSFHLVQHLVKKTVKRQKSMSRRPQCSDSSSSDTDESDREFLESVNCAAQTKDSVTYVPQHSGVKTGSVYSEAVVKDAESEMNSNDKVIQSKEEIGVTDASACDVSSNDNGELCGGTVLNGKAIKTEEEISNEETVKADPEDGNTVDVFFKGKFVQTQITVHVILMILQGEDSLVLQLIDQPLVQLLREAGTSMSILQFAENQYGDNMTLMDLEPALVISIIDAVRYRTVAIDLLQSTLFSLTKSLSSTLHPSTIDTAMMFYKTLFSNPHLQAIFSDDNFLLKFRRLYQNATTRMNRLSSVEELSEHFQSANFVI